jgi:hypothetical protein
VPRRRLRVSFAAAPSATQAADESSAYIASGPVARALGLSEAEILLSRPTWDRLSQKLAAQLQLDSASLTAQQR